MLFFNNIFFPFHKIIFFLAFWTDGDYFLEN